VSVAAFSAALAERLSAHLHVERVTPASSQETLAHHVTPASGNGDRSSVLILETDAVISPWTESCLANADRILVVANADGDPGCGEIERTLLSNRDRLPAHRDLILLQPRELPCFPGTKRWLEHRYIDAHHHVVLGCAADLDRVGRFITGRAIGLVLSGGGARAFAHIGVIRAFREAGTPIDVVAGVSMGAMIGAQLALGWAPETMAQKNREAWINRKPLVDYTVPIFGLLSGGRFKDMLAWMFGDTQIEDLRIPFFCMSANLTLCEPVVHWDGPLKRWLRASVSLPGIAPPLPNRGELLADGGLITNLPVDVMRLFVDGQIIASDVASRIPLEVDAGLDDHPSPWRFLKNRLNPFARALRYPTVLEVVWRTALLSSARAVEDNRRDIDFYVHPNVDDIRLFQWDAIDQIIEEGYRAAAAAIGERDPLLPA
jgi:predicted acylesterase/phospholipase RssA